MSLRAVQVPQHRLPCAVRPSVAAVRPTRQVGEVSYAFSKPAPQMRKTLEMKADFTGERSRSDVVGSTKGREEIVKCGLVGYVYDCEARTPTKTVTMEKIVIAKRNIKQICR